MSILTLEAEPGDYVIVKNDEEEAAFKQLKKFGDTEYVNDFETLSGRI